VSLVPEPPFYGALRALQRLFSQSRTAFAKVWPDSEAAAPNFPQSDFWPAPVFPPRPLRL